MLSYACHERSAVNPQTLHGVGFIFIIEHVLCSSIVATSLLYVDCVCARRIHNPNPNLIRLSRILYDCNWWARKRQSKHWSAFNAEVGMSNIQTEHRQEHFQQIERSGVYILQYLNHIAFEFHTHTFISRIFDFLFV